jgi:hypothetical protein
MGSQSEGFSMQLGPDGVRVEVREEVNGEEQTKTYEAESLEALLETYPELKDRVDAGGGLRLGLRGQGLSVPDRLRGLDDLPMRTDRLGVQVREPGAFSRTVPGLASDTGLEVVGVLPGSLGEALGLSEGDVVVLLNGRTIHGIADVKTALAERLEGEGVEVEVIGRDDQTRTRRWEPQPKSTGPQPLRPL